VAHKKRTEVSYGIIQFSQRNKSKEKLDSYCVNIGKEKFSVGYSLMQRCSYTFSRFRHGPGGHCNMILAGAPRPVTDRLQRVLNAAARLVSGTRKYDRGLSQILYADLHWLDVADRVRYKLAVTVHRCLHNKAPKYLSDCCIAVSDIAGRQRRAHHVVTNWTCHVINAVHSAVAHFLSPDQSSEIRFQTN